jgi:hypothetical protein
VIRRRSTGRHRQASKKASESQDCRSDQQLAVKSANGPTLATWAMQQVDSLSGGYTRRHAANVIATGSA